jgi:Holliday junction resolvase RusA-like endonuclease
MEQTVTILHRFVSLNEYIDRERANRYAAAAIKKKETAVAEEAMKELKPIEEECTVRFIWYLTNKRRDLDNIAFAKKFILDGAVKAGVIPNDNVKYITGFEDIVVFSEVEKVEVTFIYG